MSEAGSLKRGVGTLLRAWTRPLVTMRPIEHCPGWLATLHNVKVPGNVEPNVYESPEGSSNIRIIFGLLEPALALPGNVAECGVWQGSTLIPTGLFVRRRGPAKRVMGFDSFQGLDQTVSRDVELGGDADPRKRVGGFSNTSYEAVAQRVRQFGLSGTVTLAPGYFQDTLPRHADSRFCFVHLDCVIYESYRQCLEFFFPRMVTGGIMLLDEYKDPTWPGCTQAVDEFLTGRAERIIEIKSDNHLKYYLRKL
jgi:O-methyltransferase